MWLHGFTQTRDSAHEFRSILAEGREVWTLDLPGHGDAASIEASLSESADLVADALAPEACDLGGYSMGARVALHVALRHPDQVARLVLLGASRGLADDEERAARRSADAELADHVLEVGAERFLDEWLARPMFARLPADALERAARSRDAAGLARSLRMCGLGTQDWLGDAVAAIEAPTTTLAGALDVKFVLEAESIAATVTRGRVALVPDAGHAAHLESPTATATAVADFLA